MQLNGWLLRLSSSNFEREQTAMTAASLYYGNEYVLFSSTPTLKRTQFTHSLSRRFLNNSFMVAAIGQYFRSIESAPMLTRVTHSSPCLRPSPDTLSRSGPRLETKDQDCHCFIRTYALRSRAERRHVHTWQYRVSVCATTA